MGTPTNIALIDAICGHKPGDTITIFAGGHGGKSIWPFEKFNQWWDNGNRMPSNEKVIYYDIEHVFDESDDEELIKQMNFIWFMITFFGGFHNAQIMSNETVN